jgi:endonuclease-3
MRKAGSGKPVAGSRQPVARKRKLKGKELSTYALEVLRRLKKAYPDAHTELNFVTPLQLLISTILSAQCTDKRVNMVTPELFRVFPTARDLAAAEPAVLEEMIRTTGFFRNKTKSLLGMSAAIVERHNGEVPRTMAELVALPGVGRKTANVVLGNALGVNEGVVVDTHVGRLSNRLGFTNETDPVKVEQVLMRLIPRDDWVIVSHLLIFHGRRVCIARTPRCAECVLNDICPSSRV